jgi:hypothetical protein
MSKEHEKEGTSMADEKIPMDTDDKAVDHLDPQLKQHREELQKQYEIPKIKVGFLTILGYGTPLDYFLQILGAIMSIGAGIFPRQICTNLRGGTPSHVNIDRKFNERLWQFLTTRSNWIDTTSLCRRFQR